MASAAVGGGLRVRAGAWLPLVAGQRRLPGGHQAPALGDAALAGRHRGEERRGGDGRRGRHGQARLREVQRQALRLRGRRRQRHTDGRHARQRRQWRNRSRRRSGDYRRCRRRRLDGPAAEAGVAGTVQDGYDLAELGDGLVGDLAERLLLLLGGLVRRGGL